MPDFGPYTFYIYAAYAFSAVVLTCFAALTFLAMRKTERELNDEEQLK